MKKKNNHVLISGKIVSNFVYNFCVNNEKFYEAKIEIKRLSDVVDTIPVVVSEKNFDVCRNYIGKTVYVEGSYKSYNLHKNGRTFLLLYVLAEKIKILDNNENLVENIIILNGFLCIKPKYRKTPLGRVIADAILAVDSKQGKSSYIPCIFWEKNADIISEFEVGANVQVLGRIQSRKYVKKISETEIEERIAYEVSVSKVKYRC